VVSDERFSLLWLRSRLGSLSYGSGKISRGYSPRSLLLALCRRGIDRETARRALDGALDQETETALLRRYLGKRGLDSQDRYLRPALKREGFSPAVIRAFLEEEP
jgi:SOS response regulatory protein OraA/RecX